MKKHLIIATYDGINTHYSGVGTIAKNIINALNDFAGDVDLQVSIAYIEADKNAEIFNRECFDASTSLVNKTGGVLMP